LLGIQEFRLLYIFNITKDRTIGWLHINLFPGPWKGYILNFFPQSLHFLIGKIVCFTYSLYCSSISAYKYLVICKPLKIYKITSSMFIVYINYCWTACERSCHTLYTVSQSQARNCNTLALKYMYELCTSLKKILIVIIGWRRSIKVFFQ